MKKLLFLLCLSVFVLSCSSESGKDEAKEIKLNLAQGSTYDFKQNSQINIKQTIGGQAMDMDMNIIANMAFEVVEVTGDVYTLNANMTHMKMSMSNPGMSIDADSDVELNEDANIVQQLFSVMIKEMTNKPFTIKISNKGTVESVAGMDIMYQDAMEAVAAKFPDLAKEQVAATLSQMKQAYGEEAMKGSMEMYLNLYPDVQVNVNDTWTKNINMQSGMEGKYDVTYTYAGEQNGNMLIKGKGELKTADKDAYSKINGMDAKYDLNGKYDAEYELDPETGWITKATITQSTGGNVEIKPNDQIPDGMTIPMEMSGTTTIN